MTELDRRERIFLVLVGAFLLALVVANVFAASKLIQVDLGVHVIVVAVGILPYPITFLVTDLISELYGRERANFTVLVGFAMSVGLLLFIEVGKRTPAFDPVQQEAFASFFSSNTRAVSASMLAYLVAQLVDVRLFHWWKRITRGKHLWLRNNGSTLISQGVDSVMVISVTFGATFIAGGMTLGAMLVLMGSNYLFKMCCALADTPFFYLGVHYLKRYLDLSDEEIHAHAIKD